MIVNGKTFPWVSVPDEPKQKSECLKALKKILEDMKARGIKADDVPYKQAVEMIGIYSK